MSFDSIPNETLTNIIIGEQRLLRWATEPDLNLPKTQKQSTRSNISVKNKKTKFYYPLGVYALPTNGENKSPQDSKESKESPKN